MTEDTLPRDTRIVTCDRTRITFVALISFVVVVVVACAFVAVVDC